MIEKEIRSVQDLLVELEADNDGYNGSVWYRGQSNKEWPLLPGYLRLDAPPSESTLIKQFKQSAAMLVQNTPAESFDWLFLMQHYGVPTRLLDWSESPLVALYFSVEEGAADQDQDAALWSLRPSELNKNAGINNVDEEFFIPSFEDIELNNYTVDNRADAGSECNTVNVSMMEPHGTS
ncbi:FRG domain-containing protein, partial [Halomonas almeriensis]|uniref:FRG domain-containing protein n=1 Tax=Halomonas almeriensis TaxID=308163 RepID=UPI0025B473E4